MEVTEATDRRAENLTQTSDRVTKTKVYVASGLRTQTQTSQHGADFLGIRLVY